MGSKVKKRPPKTEATKKCKVAAEKRRKDKITGLISELAALVPAHLLPTTNQADVLLSAIKHMKVMQKDMDCLLAGSVNQVAKTEIEGLKLAKKKLDEQLSAFKIVLKHAGIPSNFDPIKFAMDLGKKEKADWNLPTISSNEKSVQDQNIATVVVLANPPVKECRETATQTDLLLETGNNSAPVNITNNFLLVPSAQPAGKIKGTSTQRKPKPLLPKVLTVDKQVECLLLQEPVDLRPLCQWQATQTDQCPSVCSVAVQCTAQTVSMCSMQTQTENRSPWVTPSSQQQTPLTVTSTASSRFTVDYLHNKRSAMPVTNDRSESALKQLSTMAANCQVSTATPTKTNNRNFKRTLPVETTQMQQTKQIFKRKPPVAAVQQQAANSNHYVAQGSYAKTSNSSTVADDQLQYPSSINLNDPAIFDANSTTDNYWTPYNSLMPTQQNPYDWQQAFSQPTSSYYCNHQNFSVSALAGNHEKGSTSSTAELCNNTNMAGNFNKIDSSKSTRIAAKSGVGSGRRFEIAHIFPEESANSMDTTLPSFSGGGAHIWGNHSGATPPVTGPDGSGTYTGCNYYQSGDGMRQYNPHYYTYDPWNRQDHSTLPSIFQLGNSNNNTST